MPLRRPNRFLVGAPKCGTTALTEYLRGHPNVYLTSPKEPHYFASDFNRHVDHYICSTDDYLDLFRHCSATHLAIGEASFAAEVHRLESLLHRDLNHWLE